MFSVLTIAPAADAQFLVFRLIPRDVTMPRTNALVPATTHNAPKPVKISILTPIVPTRDVGVAPSGTGVVQANHPVKIYAKHKMPTTIRNTPKIFIARLSEIRRTAGKSLLQYSSSVGVAVLFCLDRGADTEISTLKGTNAVFPFGRSQ